MFISPEEQKFIEKKKTHPQSCKKRLTDIGVLLQKFLDERNLSPDMHFLTLSERFSEVVGPLLVDHVSAVSLERNTLVLKASSSAWKNELFLQKNAIITKCNSLLGKKIVKNIRFVETGIK